jgi:hypothetical protein
MSLFLLEQEPRRWGSTWKEISWGYMPTEAASTTVFYSRGLKSLVREGD